MQNKGFVKVFAVLLTLVCVFYLSFSFVTRHYNNKAKEIANGDMKVEQDYLDSLSNEKVWLGNWTLKQCREMEISLGLDLKGGMNVILEVSVPDVIKALADNKPDEAFNNALATAAKQAINSQDDVITLFVKEYHRIAPDAKLSDFFIAACNGIHGFICICHSIQKCIQRSFCQFVEWIFCLIFS